jgi:hypothetical protein
LCIAPCAYNLAVLFFLSFLLLFLTGYTHLNISRCMVSDIRPCDLSEVRFFVFVFMEIR